MLSVLCDLSSYKVVSSSAPSKYIYNTNEAQGSRDEEISCRASRHRSIQRSDVVSIFTALLDADESVVCSVPVSVPWAVWEFAALAKSSGGVVREHLRKQPRQELTRSTFGSIRAHCCGCRLRRFCCICHTSLLSSCCSLGCSTGSSRLGVCGADNLTCSPHCAHIATPKGHACGTTNCCYDEKVPEVFLRVVWVC